MYHVYTRRKVSRPRIKKGPENFVILLTHPWSICSILQLYVLYRKFFLIIFFNYWISVCLKKIVNSKYKQLNSNPTSLDKKEELSNKISGRQGIKIQWISGSKLFLATIDGTCYRGRWLNIRERNHRTVTRWIAERGGRNHRPRIL